MVDNRDPLFREIDEELRREQFAKLWNQYGTYLVLGVALIVAGVGGFKWLEARRAAQAEAAGARYQSVVSLVEQGKSAEARAALQAIADGGPAGYSALARLQLAAAAVKAGDKEQARAAYEALSNDGGVDPLLRDFARLQAAALMLDTASWTEMQNRLKPLLGDNSPWRYSARELLGLAAFRAGEFEEARKALTELVTEARVPPSIRERAGIVMGLVTAAGAAKPAVREGSETPASGASGAGGTPAAPTK